MLLLLIIVFINVVSYVLNCAMLMCTFQPVFDFCLLCVAHINQSHYILNPAVKLAMLHLENSLSSLILLCTHCLISVLTSDLLSSIDFGLFHAWSTEGRWNRQLVEWGQLSATMCTTELRRVCRHSKMWCLFLKGCKNSKLLLLGGLRKLINRKRWLRYSCKQPTYWWLKETPTQSQSAKTETLYFYTYILLQASMKYVEGTKSFCTQISTRKTRKFKPQAYLFKGSRCLSVFHMECWGRM